MPSRRTKSLLRRTARRLGYEVHNAALGSTARRTRAMAARGVDLVLDVGANVGQYGLALRESGFDGRIVSFEPLPDAYAELHERTSHDPFWTSLPAALGAEPGRAELNISESSVLSSLLPAAQGLSQHIAAARVTNTVHVDVKTLDGMWDDVVQGARGVLLKIDTQGFEHAVLDGARESLPKVTMVEVEASLITTYEGGSSIHDVLPRLHEAGFGIIAIDCLGGFVDPATGQALDVNILAGRALP